MASILGALSISTGTSSLKAIDGDTVFHNDICLVIESDGFYVYQLVSPSTTTEDSPKVIAPTTNGTNKRWILRPDRYYSENLELDKDNYIKLREIREKDTDGIIFTLSNGTEIARIDSTGLVLGEALTITDGNLNLDTLNGDPLTDYVKSDGSVGFDNQIKGVNPIADDDLSTKYYVDTEISSAISPVDLSNYIQFNNSTPFSPSASYQPATLKYVNDTVNASGAMKISVYDTDEDGIVDLAELATLATSAAYAELAGTITGQGLLATQSEITSGYINSGSAPEDYVMVSDGVGGIVWNVQSGSGSSSGGISKLEKRPNDFQLDDTMTGISKSSMWSMTDTLSFNGTTDGACWINFVIPDGFLTTSDILIDLFYTLNGNDIGNDISLKTEIWSTSVATSATSGSNEASNTDTITSSTTNIGNYTKLTLPNGKIPNAAIESTDDLITIKFTRLDTDTYNGSLELISVIFYQE